jgi:hypothetical protein
MLGDSPNISSWAGSVKRNRGRHARKEPAQLFGILALCLPMAESTSLRIARESDMTAFTPTKASGCYFYRYQSAEHLDRLKPIVLEQLPYVPSVAQLNDPADCRPKIKPMLVEEMVTFLKNDYIRRNPILALDLLQEHESTIRVNIQAHGLEWFQRELSKILNSQMEQFRVYSLSRRFDNLSLTD